MESECSNALGDAGLHVHQLHGLSRESSSPHGEFGCMARCAGLGEARVREAMGSRQQTKLDCNGDPVDMFLDNSSAIDVAYNPEHHTRMKHVERRHFYVRELVESGELKVGFTPGVGNIADILTKPLAPRQFVKLRALLMNLPPPRA